jgi:hypothetical protein
MNPRPSYRELNGKLEEARQAASAKRVRFVDPDAIYADLLDLDFLMDALEKALPKILLEITPKGYRGQRPPQRSYEKSILDSEL